MQRLEEERLRHFEVERRHLLCVAFRILGSQTEAEDVVQETWIKYDRTNTTTIKNLPAWLTTVAARICVDVLRRRREIPEEERELPQIATPDASQPEETTLLASELVTAFTIVLEELTPPQRVAVVLHDAFGMPFKEIAHILNTTPVAAKKLASRARACVRRRSPVVRQDNPNARQVAEAFLHAAREGDTGRLMALLDPNVIRIADPQVLPTAASQRVEGAPAVVSDAARFRAFALRGRVAQIDGSPGIVISSEGNLKLAIVLQVADKRIVRFDVIADPKRLRVLRL